uniref:E4 protein n=1 Tax=Human papillomavirus TaxID=10566 RepID=A0A385PHV2_9PAPI|nr:MAG: E4 protein [Human papillomavirus]
MLPDIAKLVGGKYMLIRTLCLLLSLVLRHLLETGEKPPSTPFPGRGRPTTRDLPPPCPPTNGHSPQHPDDTKEKPLARPPPGRRDKEKERKPLPGDQGPPHGGEHKPQGEGTDGEEDPSPSTPSAPPTGEGEGEVEGGPQHGPNHDPNPTPVPVPDPEGLLPQVASRLVKWENEFDQLVATIMGDLNDYWQRLKIPQ